MCCTHHTMSGCFAFEKQPRALWFKINCGRRWEWTRTNYRARHFSLTAAAYLYSALFISFYSTQVALKNDVIKSNERGRKIRSAFNDAVRVMCALKMLLLKAFILMLATQSPWMKIPAGRAAADAVNLGFWGVVPRLFHFAQRRSPDLFAASLTPFIRIFGNKCGTFPALHTYITNHSADNKRVCYEATLLWLINSFFIYKTTLSFKFFNDVYNYSDGV